MCFGGSAPKAPEIKYVGPSEDDIRRQEESLATFQQQIADQQAATAASIQKQIDAANKRTADIQAQYDEELAAAAAETSASEAAAAEAAKAAETANATAAEAAKKAEAANATYTPIGAYGVTASQSEATTAQKTTAIKPKKKPKSTLKISPSAVAQAGSGLNIGV